VAHRVILAARKRYRAARARPAKKRACPHKETGPR
jgi:hypothetical protein